jgi:hypothetical protein
LRKYQKVFELHSAGVPEDYTAGHPDASHVANWSGNEKSIRMIEAHSFIRGPKNYKSLDHMFPYMQKIWNSGAATFSSEEVQDWTKRVTQAGGAITWAVALESSDKDARSSRLADPQFTYVKELNNAFKSWKNTNYFTSC